MSPKSIALVEGISRRRRLIDVPIGRDKQQRKRIAAVAGPPFADGLQGHRVFDARPLPIRWSSGPQTGRTHQIRVHFAWMGFPLAGDRVYGRRRPQRALPLQRHFCMPIQLTFRCRLWARSRSPHHCRRTLPVCCRVAEMAASDYPKMLRPASSWAVRGDADGEHLRYRQTPGQRLDGFAFSLILGSEH
jgi:hypothetical protein